MYARVPITQELDTASMVGNLLKLFLFIFCLNTKNAFPEETLKMSKNGSKMYP
jgi:hypothetical protein